MNRFSLFGLTAVITLLLLGACQGDHPPAVKQGSVQLAFDNVVGEQDLVLGNTRYVNKGGELFTVTTLNYYVTNIQLLREEGTRYIVPPDSSYFLVRESDPSTQLITLHGVPHGNYVGVVYTLGVDSLRNTMGLDRRKGVLDPGGGHQGGMYWDWNSGYIHFKFEGNSASAPDGNYVYHIGLFGGYQSRTLNNLRQVQIPFDHPVSLTPSKVPKIAIQADVLRIFDGPTQLRLATQPLIMLSPSSAGVADNYAQMFSLKRITTTPE